MKTIFRIARLELKTLFYSPVAWLVLVIFIFQAGLSFADVFEKLIRWIKLDYYVEPHFTSQIFTGGRGLFSDVVNNLYLYIPLLTMGLMSRELSSGSIKLLFSSPIRISEIILGKFFSMAVYGFILILILLLFAVAGNPAIQNLDVRNIISALIGIYLLICAYSAIGLFMSCLTSYQVIAAISTLVVFAALNFIGKMGQDIDFVRDLTYFISIAGRTNKFMEGLIRSNDVCYFLIVILLFLGLSYLKLVHGRESKHHIVKLFRYTFFTALLIMTGYITSLQLLRRYIDMTATKSNTITVASQTLMKKIDKPVTITAFVNILDGLAFTAVPVERNKINAYFEPYMRYKPRIAMKYVYFYDSLIADENWLLENRGKSLEQLARKKAEALKIDFRRLLTPEQIKKRVDLSAEENRVVWQLEYNGRKTYLRMFRDNFILPSESEIMAGLKRFLVTPPKIYFLTGHNERSIFKWGDRDYKSLNTVWNRFALINQGFDLDTLNLSTDPIPENISALVIADPQSALTEEDSAKITEYIKRGGNLLIAGKNGRQSLLNPILRSVGVHAMEGTLMQYSKDFAADFIIAKFNKPAGKDTASWNIFYNKDSKVSMPGSAAMEYQDTGAFHYYPVLLTNGETWKRPVEGITDATPAVFDPSKGDAKKEMITALGITRNISGKQQRIMVIGSADFMSYAEFSRNNMQNSNLGFTQNIFKWFAYEAFPIDISFPEPKDKKLLIEQSQIIWLRLLFQGLLPGILIISGSILLIRRRRR